MGTRTLICELPGCDVTFTTNRSWQRFCSKEHRIKYHQSSKGRMVEIERRLEKLEETIETLDKAMGKRNT